MKKHSEKKLDKVLFKLSHEEEVFLLSLRAEEPSRPNSSYIKELKDAFGTTIMAAFLVEWFKYRFEFSGNFRKASKVPMDKFKESNWFRYYEYRMLLNLITDHSVFVFVDEKHISNSNGHDVKVRRDPLTGIVPCIKVSGNFRDSYSIIAAISPNPEKEHPIYATMSKTNNDSNAFMVFIESMITSGYLKHNDVVVMDNAGVHTGGAANVIQDVLWNQEVDGRALNVLVLFLPPRSPELNPIELVFNILTSKVKSYRFRQPGAPLTNIVERVQEVFENDIDIGIIRRCCQHCGYRVGIDDIMDEF